MTREQIKTQWNDYVRHHLLPRLHGFELMMAPYAIAHMKIGLKLTETGYTFPEDGPRVNVFLTNALQPAQDVQRDLEGLAPMLAHEANAANLLKARLAVTVVVGNPPYSGISGNMFPWIDGLLKGQLPDGQLVESYYRVDGKPLGEKKLWLQDDYVKFIRLGQWRIECSGVGVLGYVTNHGYLDNPTFRGMRQCLMNTFGRIDVIDLHGNSKKKEKAPDGIKDENVFDIEQGVAIGLLRTSKVEEKVVRHSELFGRRVAKYDALTAGRIQSTQLQINTQLYFLGPFGQPRDENYEVFWPVTSLTLRYGLGFQTSRDDLVVGFTTNELTAKIERFTDLRSSDEEIRQVFFGDKKVGDYETGDTRQWSLGDARRRLSFESWQEDIRSSLYRPFDWRPVLYRADMVDWPRPEVLGNMLHDNLALLVNRQTKDDFAVLCARQLTERKIAARYDASSTIPIWLYSSGGHKSDLHDDDLISELPSRTANLNPAFVLALRDAMGLSDFDWQPEKRSAPLHVEKVFHYLYAVLHSPTYRSRYAGFLRIDFPRIPIPASLAVFDALAALGEQLVQWHLLEHSTAIAITDTSVPAGVTAPAFVGTDRQLLKVAEKGRELADLGLPAIAAAVRFRSTTHRPIPLLLPSVPLPGPRAGARGCLNPRGGWFLTVAHDTA